MNINPIDIPKSIKSGKIVYKRWKIEIAVDFIGNFITIFIFPFISGISFYFNFIRNQPFGISLFFLIISLIFGFLMFYSIINLNKLKLMKGLSRGNNFNIIKKIAKNNNWNIYSTNHQITIINFSWKLTGTDWGKQMVILYDGNNILVNCTSFGRYSSPSPFHWFANRKKLNKLISEFENEIKNLSHKLKNEQNL
jgi:hypothetical protein